MIIGSRLVRAAEEAGSPEAAAEAVARFLRETRVALAGNLPAAMGMVVTLFLALGAMTVSYAFGQGGPVAGIVFLWCSSSARISAWSSSKSSAPFLGAAALRRGWRSPRGLRLEDERSLAGGVRRPPGRRPGRRSGPVRPRYPTRS